MNTHLREVSEVAPPPAAQRLEVAAVKPPEGIVRRFFTTHRHFVGLLFGGLVASVRARKDDGTKKGMRFVFARAVAAMAKPLLRNDLVQHTFAVQLRRRFELLGPTYIKLGQILSLREDILPRSVTDELKGLLSHLPAVPLDALVEIMEADLRRPVKDLFTWIDPEPLGSASIAQTHRATTREADPVILKVVKPGIAVTLQRDTRLLRGLGVILEWLFPRYQPKRVIDEFCQYTLREVDLHREADNAETFAANFADMHDVVFPEVYREYSGKRVLCMEFFDGLSPESSAARALPEGDRKHLTDLGAAAIIRMLYRDGFFHADLHPGNLVILPERKVGFIDLGMVGRLDDELRRTLLYYYYSLITGDAENAARYLTAVAEPARSADPTGFRREVTEISHRWRLSATFDEFSLGQLILESVTRGAEYRMYFPVEMVLMVKALVTFEGVGHLLLPELDVADLSRKHIRRVFIEQFSPARLLQEGLRGAPDVVDAMVKMPLLMTEGLRVLERSARETPENPLSGLRGTLTGGFCLVAGAIVMAFGGPWPLWAGFFVIGLGLAIRR